MGCTRTLTGYERGATNPHCKLRKPNPHLEVFKEYRKCFGSRTTRGPDHEPEDRGTVPGSEALGGQTKFISETLSEKMLIFEMKIKNVGFVNNLFCQSNSSKTNLANEAL